VPRWASARRPWGSCTDSEPARFDRSAPSRAHPHNAAVHRRPHVVDLVEDVVDEAVRLRLLRSEPAIAPAIALDHLERLAGVLRDEREHRGADPLQLFGVDLDV